MRVTHAAPDQDLIWRELYEELMLSPGRTLFVAKSWPPGADPAVYFTDASLALAAAAALTPAPDVNNPAVIIFYPGIYSQALTLVSNVHMFGHNVRGCSLTGPITWNPSQGVNASQAGLFERVYVGRMSWSGALSIDCTAKPLFTGTTFDTRDVDLSGNVTHLGRAPAGAADQFQCWDGVHGGTTWSFNGSLPLFFPGNQFGANNITFSNCTQGSQIAGSRVFGHLHLVNTPGCEGSGNKFVDVDVDGTSVFGPIPGSKTGVVTVAAGGSADLRGAEYFVRSNLVGPGAIDRSLFSFTFGPTVAGANTVQLVPFFPPYIDANYTVVLTQNGGAAALITVSGKAVDQFVLHDSVGGNTFDVAIIKE